MNTWLIAIASLTLTGLVSGCRCGSDVQPVEPADAVTEIPAEEVTPEEIGVSAEVSQLIDAGDPTAIAADMELRAQRLRAIAGTTKGHTRALEQIAESMTGREATLDPRDPAVVAALVASAADLGQGVEELEPDLTTLRQLVVDLQAEAEALYGRPQP